MTYTAFSTPKVSLLNEFSVRYKPFKELGSRLGRCKVGSERGFEAYESVAVEDMIRIIINTLSKMPKAQPVFSIEEARRRCRSIRLGTVHRHQAPLQKPTLYRHHRSHVPIPTNFVFTAELARVNDHCF